MSATRPFAVVLIVAALALPGCGKGADAGNASTAGAVAGAIPGPGDGWTEQVVKTPEGGFRMGNPDAKAKLIEYASFTCPHCAEFSAESAEDIRKMVATGRLSYEFRNLVRDPFDLTAALLARCGGAKPFFKLADQLYASQQEWIGNAQNMTPADQQKIQSLPQDQQFAALARGMGLNAFFGQRGVPEAKAQQCLSDKAEPQRLVDMAKTASTKYQIDFTPGFVLNGEAIGSFKWADLKPRLVTAMGG